MERRPARIQGIEEEPEVEAEEPDNEGHHPAGHALDIDVGGLDLGGGLYLVETEWKKKEAGKRWSRQVCKEICAVEKDECISRYDLVTVTADSGAVDHVAPANLAPKVPIKETEASRHGMHYVAANGSRIPNQGEKRVTGYTADNTRLGMTWQIAEVKTLASIGRMCDAGNIAIFTKEGGYIMSRESVKDAMQQIERGKQHKLKMTRSNGVYSFQMRVPADPPRASAGSGRVQPGGEDPQQVESIGGQ